MAQDTAAVGAASSDLTPRRDEGNIRTALDAVVANGGNIIAWLVFIAMGISVFEVGMRYLLNDPTSWVHETVVFLIAIIFAIGGPVALARDKHIRVRILYDTVGDDTRRWLDLLNTILTLLFTVAMSYAAYVMFTRSAFNPLGEFQLERSGTSWNPPFPSLTKLAILVALAIMTAQAVWHALQAMQRTLPLPVVVVLVALLIGGGIFGAEALLSSSGFGLRNLGIQNATYILIGSIFLLLIPGLPLAFVTGIVALFFTFGWFGTNALTVVTANVYGFVTKFPLVAVPMFVFMASLLDRSGIARDLFNAMRLFAGRIPGGVAVQTLVVAFFLATMSGIIGGEIVLLGMLALPQMLRLGYDRRIAIGVVCAGGSLGTMVPPSIVLIIYGLMANESIADLFLAAITPAVILMLCYMTYVLIRCGINPSLGPPLPEDERMSFSEKLNASRSVVLPLLIAVMVLGSIYGGIASVTEAAAMGVFGTILAIIIRGEFTPKLLQQAVGQTLNTCGMIVWIGVGAATLVGVYNLMGGTRFVSAAILGLDTHPIVIIMVMMGILLVLGLFMDWIGIALLTLPIFVPIVTELGYDPIWFGVLFAVNMQVSFLSPPFGPAAFYLKSVAPPHITLGNIFGSLIPFICIQICVLALILFFPGISTWIL